MSRKRHKNEPIKEKRRKFSDLVHNLSLKKRLKKLEFEEREKSLLCSGCSWWVKVREKKKDTKRFYGNIYRIY